MPIWDEQIARVGTYIIMERLNFTDKIGKIARKIHKEISSSNEDLEVLYEPSIGFNSPHAEEIEENYLYILESSHDEDIKRGSTGKGCHRDDLAISIDNMDVRTFGSQGQQRTAVLSLKLSK